MTPPISIDGTDITGATIDGQDVQEITVDGQTVFTALPDIPDSGPNHQWDFTQDDQSTVTDQIGSLNGAVSGATLVTGGDGADSAYMEFNGNGDNVDLGVASRSELSHFINNGEGTYFGWVKPNSGSNGMVFGVGAGSNKQEGLTLRYQNPGFRALLGTGSNFVADASGGIAAVDEWTPVAVILTGSELIIREGSNMSQVASDTISGTKSGDGDTNYAFGASTGSGIDFGGEIDLSFVDQIPRSQTDLQDFVSDSESFYS